MHTTILASQTATHFHSSVSANIIKHLADFMNEASTDFISEFTDSYGVAAIATVEGTAYSGFIPINCKGGFKVTEWYRNDQDSCSHFTKQQTNWKDKQAALNLVEFCQHYDIDEATALSEDWEDKLLEWESALNEPALLDLRCFVTDSDTVQVEVLLDYKGEDTFNWETLYSKEFKPDEFLNLDTCKFFEELITSINEAYGA